VRGLFAECPVDGLGLHGGMYRSGDVAHAVNAIGDR
jgi:hypothetical protein